MCGIARYIDRENDSQRSDNMFVMHDHINKYHYVVNTFDENGYSIQTSGDVFGESEEDAIQELINIGAINELGYEFLELSIV